MTADSKKNCDSCNKKGESKWKYCPNCGEKLEYDLEQDSEQLYALDLPFKRGWSYGRITDSYNWIKKRANRVEVIGKAVIPYNSKIGAKISTVKELEKQLDKVGAEWEIDKEKVNQLNRKVVREEDLEEVEIEEFVEEVEVVSE